MRNNLLESVIIGCGIALAVALIHVLTQGADAIVQLLALLAAGAVLFCVQLGLASRHAANGAPPDPQGESQQRPRTLRRRRRNPFTRELTHDWMGLEDHPAERDQASPYTPDALDEDLWGEPPGGVARKPAAKIDDPR